jgi:hypothetical protein
VILNKFGAGWVDKFENRLQSLYKFFPDIKLVSVQRYLGMLRVEFEALDSDIQDVINSVAYKIERESSKTCELCGNHGRRHEEHLEEKMCLCWKCYALKANEFEIAQNNNLNNE